MFFFDTYALVALLEGNRAYREWAGRPAVCHQMNLLEAMVQAIKAGTPDPAPYVLRLRIRPVHSDFHDLAAAAALKTSGEGRKRRLSYVDALGYVLARRHSYTFVTGDDGFAGLPGVELVKAS